MDSIIIQLVFIILFPALTIFLASRFRIFRFISPIIICYGAGIIIGNSAIITVNTDIVSKVSEISICLAIPVLLFSSNFIQWLNNSKKAFLAYFLAVVSVVISSVFAFYIFRSRVPEASKISAMLIGVYTGGTPNMTAIGLALDVDTKNFILLNSADIFFCGIYFIFLISVAKSFLKLFLPQFKFSHITVDNKQKPVKFNELEFKTQIIYVLISISLSVIVFAIAVLISLLFKESIATPIIILTLTTLSISASFSRRIHSLHGTYETAEYLLLIFAVAIGSMANFTELLKDSSLIFTFCGIVVGSSIILHILFSIIFRIDTDTLIITSTAALFGPAFIGPVANGIKNRQIIISGITMGLLGYAIGNYLGLAVAFLLKNP